MVKYGLIDSGLGGYAFLKGIYKKENKYILIMDKSFFPYGNKSKEFLIKRTLYLTNYLIKYKKVDKVILACNTLSLLALPFLKTLYNEKIMGVFELIPTDVKNSVYIATKNSIKVYSKNSIDGSDLIRKIQEKKDVKKDIKELCKDLKKYDLIILGCTHFILFKDEFRKYNNVCSQDELFLF